MQMNLPPGVLQIAATLLVLVSPFAKFALTLEPVAQGADAYLGLPSNSTAGAALQKRAVRSGLAALALLLATEVPFFGVFMSLLGAFLTLSVSVLFPCLAHLRLHWHELYESEKSIDFAVLLIGSIATVMGTSTALQSIPGISPDPLSAYLPLSASTHAFKTLVCHSVCVAV